MGDQLKNACNGKTYSQGGLNVPQMKKALKALYPDNSRLIDQAKTRNELDALCIKLMNQNSKQIRKSPTKNSRTFTKAKEWK
jgi:hypothetical protein